MGAMQLYGQQIIHQSWLRYGDEVKFSIRPSNMHGEATNEQEAICENVLMMLPSPPMHLREVASETTQNYITWTWDLPQSAAWHTFGDIHFNTAQLRNLPQYWDGGSPILSYRVAVYSQTDDAYEVADAEMQEYDVTSPMQLTKYYTRGQWYDVQMYSTNLFGESAEYSEVSILQAQVPWAITDGETSQLIYAGMYNGVEDTSAKKNFVRFRWFDNNNGGVPITDYHVQVFAEDQETGFDTASCSGLEIDGSGTTSCYVSIFDLTDTAGQWGFTWGQNVTFRVRAYNEKGWSLWSDVLGGTSIYYKADPPTALTIDHLLTEADYIYLSWTAPTEDNGSDITEYEVYKNQASNPTVWTLIYQTEEVFQEITEFIIPCQEYNFTVTSMNGYGESDLAVANATEVPMSKPENFTVVHTYADPASEGDFFPNTHTFTFTFPDYTDTDVSGGCAMDEIRGFWGETGEDGAPGLAGYPMMNITVTEGVPGNDSIVIDADMWEVGYNESITYGTDFGKICFTFGYGDKNLECIVGST